MERILHTKNGVPIRLIDGNLFDTTGTQVGRFDGETVYSPDGRYAATLKADRLVYLPVHRGRISYPFAPTRIVGSSARPAIASTVLGEEPFTTDHQ